MSPPPIPSLALLQSIDELAGVGAIHTRQTVGEDAAMGHASEAEVLHLDEIHTGQAVGEEAAMGHTAESAVPILDGTHTGQAAGQDAPMGHTAQPELMIPTTSSLEDVAQGGHAAQIPAASSVEDVARQGRQATGPAAGKDDGMGRDAEAEAMIAGKAAEIHAGQPEGQGVVAGKVAVVNTGPAAGEDDATVHTAATPNAINPVASSTTEVDKTCREARGLGGFTTEAWAHMFPNGDPCDLDSIPCELYHYPFGLISHRADIAISFPLHRTRFNGSGAPSSRFCHARVCPHLSGSRFPSTSAG